jgi:hypothetical protein
MTDTPAIQIDSANVIDGAGTISPLKKDLQNTGHSMLNRLVLWLQKEAHLLGIDIEAEIAAVLGKIRVKSTAGKV